MSAQIESAREIDSPSATTERQGFRFIEWNEVRALRGKEAARVALVEYGKDTGWLWMSKNDIAENIVSYGQHPELLKALAQYRF